MKTRGSVKRKRDAEAAQELFPAAMSIVVKNCVIDAAGLGKLIQTSKKNRRVMRSDDTWAPLCLHMWPNTASVPKEVIARHGGFRVWYKHRLFSVAQPDFGEPPKLDPPSVTANDLILLVDFKKKGKSLFSGSVTGDELLPLLTNGKMTISNNSNEPAVLGEVESWGNSSDGFKAFGPKDYNGEDYDASMQLVRLTDSHTCCVFERTLRWPDIIAPEAAVERGPPGPAIIDWEDASIGYLGWGDGVHDTKKGLPLRKTAAAGQIRNRFPAPFAFQVTPRLHIMPGKEIENGKCDLFIEAASFDIEAVKYEEEDDRVRFDSEKESRKHGVTLLHLLGELHGLFLDPN